MTEERPAIDRTATIRHDGVLALPDRLAAKADPRLVDGDEAHLGRVVAALRHRVAELDARLAAARRAPGGIGQGALDRDQEVHRLTARLRTLRRLGAEICLGRMVSSDGPAGSTRTYVGRLGLRDVDGEPLLVDWRSPAAEPFFAATHADPMGLSSRRRYRWTRGRVTDYWDEVFSPDQLEGNAALDDQSAFVASLGAARSPRMRDVLGTIQADQDAIIRASSAGPLVVDGGPGTGKTVVALHRCAYLLYADPRLGHRRGGVLVVGPHEPYLSYVADVLPSLGEEGVLTCTLRDMVPQGRTAGEETDPEVARLKGSLTLVDAIEPAVAFSEDPPTTTLAVETPWGEVVVRAVDWAEAFASAEPGTPHNEARDQVWEALLDLLLERHADEEGAADDEDGDGGTAAEVRRALSRDADLVEAFQRAWPLLDPADVVADLWSVPAFLRLCAPALTPEQVHRLQRADPTAWTVADLPLLDAARLRVGDPDAARRDRERRRALAAEQERRDLVLDDLVAAGGDEYGVGLVSMLRNDDLREQLLDEDVVTTGVRSDPDALAGPFAHVVVDEAQELTDAQWQMVLRRSPSRSLTVVGDRAQARHGFAGSWEQRLAEVGAGASRLRRLTLNYRTPAELMEAAEPVIRAAVPDANVPTSVRRSGRPVAHGRVADLEQVVTTWLAEHAQGTGCVVGAPDVAPRDRVRSLSPVLAKGLEFDLVVLVDPASFGDGVEGAVDRYVAMTRATQDLVVLTSPDRDGSVGPEARTGSATG